MIQLDRKKKIIILSILVLFIVVLGFYIYFNKSQNKSNPENVINTSTNTLPVVRDMTETEKTDKVGIDPVQEAEVVNDSNGLYIYRIKN